MSLFFLFVWISSIVRKERGNPQNNFCSLNQPTNIATQGVPFGSPHFIDLIDKKRDGEKTWGLQCLIYNRLCSSYEEHI